MKEKQIIGWEESIALPELKIDSIKAKVDSGSSENTLHAYNLIIKSKDGQDYAKFIVHPLQESSEEAVRCECKIVKYQEVEGKNCILEKRPVIVTPIQLGDKRWDMELTLTNRDDAGFRMSLGRDGIQTHFLVDTSKSFEGELR